MMLAVRMLDASPKEPAVGDSSLIGPGFIGFLVMFGLAVATLLLIRSMTHHMRKVRYSPDPAAEIETTTIADPTAPTTSNGEDTNGADPGPLRP